MEAWFRVTESTTSLVTVKFSQWIQFFCSFVSCFTSQGQTLFPPRPFFEPLWRGCNISCRYNLVSSQFLSCRQQQGARHGLTPKYSLWFAEGFCIQHWTLCCCYLMLLMLLRWYLHCTAVIAQPRMVFWRKTNKCWKCVYASQTL